MTVRLRARLRVRHGQAGVTVVEMTVVVALLALVLAMALQGLSAYQRAVAATDMRQRNLDEARSIMAVLTKDLRTATSFTSLAGGDVTFLGLVNTAANAPPNQLRLYVDSQGVVREATTPPDDPNASPITYTGTPVVRVLGRGVVSGGSLFSFRDASDATTTALSAVTSVVINLSVDLPSSAPVPPTVLSSRAFLPNVAAATSEG
jgi:type II secretory pathway pseudopilin PulG